MQFWALLVDSFRESLDRKIFWVLVGISCLVAAAMFCVRFQPDHVDFAFGMWQYKTAIYNPLTELGRANIASIAVNVADLVVGWIGLMLMLIGTASLFTAFIERGAIDLVVSKPISRSKLFLGKYLASMVFVLLQVTLFVVLTFLVMGIRWGTWLPHYLLVIPLFVILFSYVYCISVWVAVTTRSTIAAILFSIGAWVIFGGVQGLGDWFELHPSLKQYRTEYYAVRAMRVIVPKTQDITYLTKRWTNAGSDADLIPEEHAATDPETLERARGVEEARRNLSPLYTIGTSLLFEAVILMLAVRSFSRNDY